MNDPVLALLRDLVAIDSVNPVLSPGGSGEAVIADHAAVVMRRAGLDVAVTNAAPGRPNVVGVLEGRAPGRALMLCGHLDTRGVEGMREGGHGVVERGRASRGVRLATLGCGCRNSNGPPIMTP